MPIINKIQNQTTAIWKIKRITRKNRGEEENKENYTWNRWVHSSSNFTFANLTHKGQGGFEVHPVQLNHNRDFKTKPINLFEGDIWISNHNRYFWITSLCNGFVHQKFCVFPWSGARRAFFMAYFISTTPLAKKKKEALISKIPHTVFCSWTSTRMPRISDCFNLIQMNTQ